MKNSAEKYLQLIENGNSLIGSRYIDFCYNNEGNSIVNELNNVNHLFSFLLEYKKPELIKYTPYKVIISELIPKNQWTEGNYVAIEQEDGSLHLQLSFTKIMALESFPTIKLTWVLFHEFRHKIQLMDENIKSVIDFPNWINFRKFMEKETNKSEDLVNHIFHELNPAEVDANIFACEMVGKKYSGSAFDITDNSLLLLK